MNITHTGVGTGDANYSILLTRSSTVSDNTIFGISTVDAATIAIYLQYGASYIGRPEVIINGNQIHNVYNAFYISQRIAKSVNIENNVIENTVSGIKCSAQGNLTIVGNTIDTFSSRGIQAYTGKNNTIGFNRILGGPTGLYLQGSATVSNNYDVIVGNDLQGTTTPIDLSYVSRNHTTSMIGFNLGYNALVIPTSAIATPRAGMMYVNVTTGDIAVYSGTEWIWTNG